MNEITDALKKSLADAIAEFGPLSRRRLTHAERCAAFYAIHRGFPHSVVAEAFKVSRPTITALANCIANPGKTTKRIGPEFRWLGPEEFGARYTTAEHAEALKFAMNAHNARKAELNRLRFKDRNENIQAGFNPIQGARGETLFHIYEAATEWFYQPVDGVEGRELIFWRESYGPYRSARLALIEAYKIQGQQVPAMFRRPLDLSEAIEWQQNKSTNQS